MDDYPLNQIIKNEFGWTSVIFEFGRINASGLFLNYSDVVFDDVLQFDEYSFRFYKRTNKIVASSKSLIAFEYCALKLNYSHWKCLLCKKVCKSTDSTCFCSSYSNCWSPIGAEISGAYFSDALDFPYHFDNNLLSQIII